MCYLGEIINAGLLSYATINSNHDARRSALCHCIAYTFLLRKRSICKIEVSVTFFGYQITIIHHRLSCLRWSLNTIKHGYCVKYLLCSWIYDNLIAIYDLLTSARYQSLLLKLNYAVALIVPDPLIAKRCTCCYASIPILLICSSNYSLSILKGWRGSRLLVGLIPTWTTYPHHNTSQSTGPNILLAQVVSHLGEPLAPGTMHEKTT